MVSRPHKPRTPKSSSVVHHITSPSQHQHFYKSVKPGNQILNVNAKSLRIPTIHVPSPIVNISMPELRIVVERESGLKEKDLAFSEKAKEERDKSGEEMFQEWLGGELKGREKEKQLKRFRELRKQFLDLEASLNAIEGTTALLQAKRDFYKKYGFKGIAKAKEYKYV